MSVEWTDSALDDMAALDPGIAGRVKRAVERFAATDAERETAQGRGSD